LEYAVFFFFRQSLLLCKTRLLIYQGIQWLHVFTVRRYQYKAAHSKG